MNNVRYIRRFAPVLAVLVAASLSAFAKDSRTLNLDYPVSLGGTELAAGRYKVMLESHSPEATLTFMKGKQEVAQAQGKWVARNTRYGANEVLYNTNSDGSHSVMEIRFAGMSEALVFGDSGSAGEASGGTAN
jgi:hypothetical protein